jgi:hypothetical protein
MTSTRALDWLDADFDRGLQRYQQKLRREALDEHWSGPLAVRPMIELIGPYHRCTPMRVTYADYHDPERWWL